jgi:hypothetical protein
MRVKIRKTDTKLKHTFMDIIAYRSRHIEHVAPPKPTPQVGR